MQIIVRHHNNGATSEEDITDAAILFLDEIRTRSYLGLDDEDARVVLPALDALDHPSAAQLARRVRAEMVAEQERQRQRDEMRRTERERQVQRAKAAAQLAKEMREREPGLVRAGWSDAELVELHRMRNSGLA